MHPACQLLGRGADIMRRGRVQQTQPAPIGPGSSDEQLRPVGQSRHGLRRAETRRFHVQLPAEFALPQVPEHQAPLVGIPLGDRPVSVCTDRQHVPSLRARLQQVRVGSLLVVDRRSSAIQSTDDRVIAPHPEAAPQPVRGLLRVARVDPTILARLGIQDRQIGESDIDEQLFAVGGQLQRHGRVGRGPDGRQASGPAVPDQHMALVQTERVEPLPRGRYRQVRHPAEDGLLARVPHREQPRPGPGIPPADHTGFADEQFVTGSVKTK